MLKKWLVNLLLMLFYPTLWVSSQVQNDVCSSATPLCPNVSVSGSNYGASATLCANCEDDYSFCFTGTNSVWYSFTTNSNGGDATISISNIAFNIQANRGNELQATILEAGFPCDGSTYTLVSPCNAGSAIDFSLTAAALSPSTTYYILINGALNGGATLPAEATFDVTGSGPGFDRLPTAISIGGPSGLICPMVSTPFTTYLTNCTDTSQFFWYVNQNLTAVTDESLWFTSSLNDGDVVSVICSCFSICPDTLSFTFSPVSVDNLTVDAGPDQTTTMGNSVLLNGTSNGTDFLWTPAATLSNPTSLTTVAIPDQTTTYFLSASNGICTVSDDVTINISDRLIIPGSFSPNGDGINDLWYIEGIEYYPNAEVRLYDRWGQEIEIIIGYSITKAWNGTNKGKEVSSGVYFYVLDLNDPNFKDPIKGSVTIIK